DFHVTGVQTCALPISICFTNFTYDSVILLFTHSASVGASMVLPKFIPKCIFAANSTALLLMPVASGAFGDVLYDGYSRLPCDTLILLAWPFSEVTANIVEW